MSAYKFGIQFQLFVSMNHSLECTQKANVWVITRVEEYVQVSLSFFTIKTNYCSSYTICLKTVLRHLLMLNCLKCKQTCSIQIDFTFHGWFDHSSFSRRQFNWDNFLPGQILLGPIWPWFNHSHMFDLSKISWQ